MKCDSNSNMPTFTAHRVQLPDGSWTIPEQGDTIIKSVNTGVLAQSLGGLAGKRILDLGSNEGGYSVTFAQLGAREVIGVEARENNLICARYLKERLNLPQVQFVKGDVKQVSVRDYGKFDAVFACGILYHLDDPFSVLANIKDMTDDVLMLDTHVAVENNREHACGGVLIDKTFGARTYRGMISMEYEAESSPDHIEQYRWSSYGNPQSFWPTEESLKQMLWDIGFKYVLKAYTWKGYRCSKCQVECRVLLLAHKGWPRINA